MKVAADDNRDDEFAAILAAYDAQLAAGSVSDSYRNCGSSIADRGDDTLESRLDRAKHCLDILSEVWPREQSFDEPLPSRVGRFRILRELGRGGFGIVYLADDERLERPVALKVQRPEAVLSPSLRERFEREAKTAGRLRHPNIAAVYEVGQAGMRLWIAAEYCQGDTLAAWLTAKHGAVAPADAAAFIATLAQALEYSHEQQVFHRDLKPSNVLLERKFSDKSSTNGASSVVGLKDVTPKLIDFGLAQVGAREGVTNYTRAGTLLGTPAYMAPEQALGSAGKLNPATDVYGLGAILYEILTGRAPFAAETDWQVLRQIVDQEPLAPRHLRSDIPRDLEAIALKCLEKDPNLRYATARALADDLQRYLAGRPTFARPLTWYQRAGKWSKRRPAWAALLGVSVTAALAMIAMTLIYISSLKTANQAAEQSQAEARENAEESSRQERIANEFLYASRMRLAYQSLEQGDELLVKELLSHYAPGTSLAGLRGFEWYHLQQCLRNERLTLRSHQGEVYTVTYTPDGRQLVSGGADGTIRFWDRESGQLLRTVAAHASCVNTLAYSPDGAYLVSGGCDHAFKVWDAATLNLLANNDAKTGNVLALAFRNGASHQVALGGSNGLIELWDLDTNEVIASYSPIGDTNMVTWSLDGRSLYFMVGDTHVSNLVEWDVDRDESRQHPLSPASVGLATGPKGELYYATGDAAVERRLGGPPMRLTGHAQRIQAVALDVSGKLLASGSDDHSIRLWDLERNDCLKVLCGHSGRVQAVAWNSKGDELASASYDGTVKVWSLPSRDERCVELQSTRPRHGSVMQFELSDDLTYAAIRTRFEEVCVFHVQTGELLGTIKVLASERGTLQFLPNSHVLFGLFADPAVAANVSEWDVDAWRPVRTFRLPSEDLFGLSRLDNSVIADYREATVVLDIDSGAVRETIPRPSSVQAVKKFDMPVGHFLSPDGTCLAASGWREPSLLWVLKQNDLSQGRTFVGSPLAISNVAGMMAFRVGDVSVSLGNRLLDEKPKTLRHPSRVDGAVFSPNGKTLATVCGPGYVHLWSTSTGQEITRLSTHGYWIETIRFSTDSRRLGAILRKNEPNQHAIENPPRSPRDPQPATYRFAVWNGGDEP